MFKRIFLMMLLGLALSLPVQANRSGTYGPVGSQETLWTIASRLKPKGAVTVQQTMLAIYHKNPKAFTENNINSLMKGVTLQVPGYAEVRRYSRLAALRETRKHNRYWKRGIKLPRSAPPPVPKISAPAEKKTSPLPVANKPLAPAKQATVQAQTTSPVLTTKLDELQKVRAQQQQEIQSLRTQLQEAKEKNKQLTTELQQLQAVQAKSGSTPEIEQQVSKLKAQLKSLTETLEQKDNHIKMLQSSLKSASEAIKAQHADNMRLADKLRELNPAALPATAAASGKPELKLAGVQDDAAQTAPATQEQALDETKATDNGKIWADQHRQPLMPANINNNQATMPVNAVEAPHAIPVTKMLGGASNKPDAPDGTDKLRHASPLAIAIALISFFFILALIWRAFVQQRELRRIEAEEREIAEKMRKRLEENKNIKNRPADDEDKPLSVPELNL